MNGPLASGLDEGFLLKSQVVPYGKLTYTVSKD